MDSLGIPTAADPQDYPELEQEFLLLALLFETGNASASKVQAAILRVDSLPNWVETDSRSVFSSQAESYLAL